MKLTITGGAGFLGYHLCRRLKDEFESISICDIFPVNTSEYPDKIQFHKMDVRNNKDIKKLTADSDLIIHAAAALPRWKEDDIWSINVEGTRNVLVSAKEHGIKKVVVMSTVSVYGTSEHNLIVEEEPADEKSLDVYARSKIEAERICNEYRQKGICIPIFRPVTFIGSARLGVFQILYDWVRSGCKIPIIGSGKNRFQLLEVNDLVEAINLAINSSETSSNNTFNLGAEKFGTVLEDITGLCSHAGTGATPMPTPENLVKTSLALLWKLGLSPLYNTLYETAVITHSVSIENARQNLGWNPRYSNSESLINSYSWYLDNIRKLRVEGVSNRAIWAQGALSIAKRILKN